MKTMYKGFIERGEREIMKCTVFEAIELYAKIDYLRMAHPRLKQIEKIHKKEYLEYQKPLPYPKLDNLPNLGESDLELKRLRPYTVINPHRALNLHPVIKFEASKQETPKIRHYIDRNKYKNKRI